MIYIYIYRIDVGDDWLICTRKSWLELAKMAWILSRVWARIYNTVPRSSLCTLPRLNSMRFTSSSSVHLSLPLPNTSPTPQIPNLLTSLIFYFNLFLRFVLTKRNSKKEKRKGKLDRIRYLRAHRKAYRHSKRQEAARNRVPTWRSEGDKRRWFRR